MTWSRWYFFFFFFFFEFLAKGTSVKVHYRHLLCWSVEQS